MKNYINYLKRKYLIIRDIGDNYVLHIYIFMGHIMVRIFMRLTSAGAIIIKKNP